MNPSFGICELTCKLKKLVSDPSFAYFYEAVGTHRNFQSSLSKGISLGILEFYCSRAGKLVICILR
jgi:hypothetical protein